MHYVTYPLMREFFGFVRSGNAGFPVVNLVGDIPARRSSPPSWPPPGPNVAVEITEQRALELLRAAIGGPDIPVVIEPSRPGGPRPNCAERLSDGPVFLARDAAHVVPPNGGYGGNTGVQDAHTLAWKLALTLGGVAGPGLLDTHDAERRPVGELTVQQAFTGTSPGSPRTWGRDTQPIVDDFSMEIGYRYDSPASVLEPGRPPRHEHPREVRGPAGRARPARVPRARRRTAVHAGPVRPELRAAGRAPGRGLAGRCARPGEGTRGDPGLHLVGDDGLTDAGAGFRGAFGISPSGAVLVRPDGFVGWRAATAADAPEDHLRQALRRRCPVRCERRSADGNRVPR